MNALIGDIGGTKTILAIFSTDLGPRKPLIEKTYHSTHYQTFEGMVGEFLNEVQMQIEPACFGVAGPVVGRCAHITNLPWTIDASVLQSTVSFSRVNLLNDMASVGHAIPILAPEDLHTIIEGVPVPGGSIAILAPGTGLGEGFLTYSNGAYCVHASEGSHVSFAPVGKLQMDLLAYMNQQGHKHVSFERVCSGGLGIMNLYSYLKATGLEEPEWLSEQLAACEDPTPIIFTAAHDTHRACKLASDTVELFVTILGGEAGNLALKILATGGIYLGGGISPRIIKDLESPIFLEALRSKGRFRQLLTNMPLRVILNPKAGLFGAAAYGLTVAAACI
jgi:glucokinase